MSDAKRELELSPELKDNTTSDDCDTHHPTHSTSVSAFVSQGVADRLSALPDDIAIRGLGRLLDFLAEVEPKVEHDQTIEELQNALAESREMEKAYELQEEESRAELNDLKEQIIANTDILAHKEVELDETKQKLAEATTLIKEYEHTLSSQNDDYRLQVYDRLNALPFSDTTFCETLYKLFSDRVIFTEGGKATLEEYITDMRKSGNPESIEEAWLITRAIAEAGWPIWFGKNNDTARGQEEKLFKANSGFELSIHETKDTMDNPKYRDLRTFTYDGREITSPVHVKGKVGTARNSCRVYFAIDNETKKLLVYHFGKHLDTAKCSKSHRP